MSPVARNFRIPIVITALMLLGLGYWTWQAWWGGEQHALGKESHRAAVMSEMLASGLSALDRNGRLGRDEIECSTTAARDDIYRSL